MSELAGCLRILKMFREHVEHPPHTVEDQKSKTKTTGSSFNLSRGWHFFWLFAELLPLRFWGICKSRTSWCEHRKSSKSSGSGLKLKHQRVFVEAPCRHWRCQEKVRVWILWIWTMCKCFTLAILDAPVQELLLNLLGSPLLPLQQLQLHSEKSSSLPIGQWIDDGRCVLKTS